MLEEDSAAIDSALNALVEAGELSEMTVTLKSIIQTVADEAKVIPTK